MRNTPNIQQNLDTGTNIGMNKTALVYSDKVKVDISPIDANLYGLPDSSNIDTRNLYDMNTGTFQNKINLVPTKTQAPINIQPASTYDLRTERGDMFFWDKTNTLVFIGGVSTHSIAESLNGTHYSNWIQLTNSLDGIEIGIDHTGLYRKALVLNPTCLATVATIKETGILSTSGTPKLNIKLTEHLNDFYIIEPISNTVLTTGDITMPTISNAVFEIVLNINVCVIDGETASKGIVASGYFQFCQANSWKVYPMIMTTPYTMDLTNAFPGTTNTGETHYFDVTSKWTGAGNTFITQNFCSHLYHPASVDIGF